MLKIKNIDINKLKLIESIKSKTALILENRQNVNHLIDVLSILNESTELNNSQLTIDTAIRSLTKVFVRFIHYKEMVINSDETDANCKYKKWLISVYYQTIDAFLNIIKTCDLKTSPKLSLESLMKFVVEEGKYGLIVDESIEMKESGFPVDLLSRICDALISVNKDMKFTIHCYYQYLQYDDIIHYTLNALLTILKSKEQNNAQDLTENQIFVTNAFELLSSIKPKIPNDLFSESMKSKRKRSHSKANKNSESEIENLILCIPMTQNQKRFKINYERDADIFAEVWLTFLRNKLTKDVYKKVLKMMDNSIMPHFRNPLTLTDFLVESYDNSGGVFSLLSLSSLYILIQKCNLDYPKFYEKLYALLNEGIVNPKYRARFLFWTDVFLTTTHISAHVIASFVKKLSRIALTSSCDTILIILPLIGNLLIRHPNMISMMQNSNKLLSITSDPFDNNETDPENTRAIESCLWEVKSLQNHWHPEVTKTANFINQRLPQREYDLSDILENTFEQVIHTSLNQLIREKELNYDYKYLDDIITLF